MSNKKDYVGSAEKEAEEISEMIADGRFSSDEIRNKCNEALRIDGKCFPAYVFLGYLESQNNNYVKMEEYFLKALEVAYNPINTLTWDAAVGILKDMKDDERLAKYLKRFYEKKPEFFVLSELISTIWKKLNRKQDALKILDSHIQIYPNDKKAIKLRKKIMKSK